MNFKTILFSVFFGSQAIAQEVASENEIVLTNPINWFTVVYIKEDASSYQRLINEFEIVKHQPQFGCNEEYDGYEQWYCASKPKLVYRSLDAHGEKTYQTILCENNEFISKYKYFSDEMMIHHKCVIAISLKEGEPYDFFTIEQWLKEG